MRAKRIQCVNLMHSNSNILFFARQLPGLGLYCLSWCLLKWTNVFILFKTWIVSGLFSVFPRVLTQQQTDLNASQVILRVQELI